MAKDEKVHTHRIGRTARAGKGGLAITLYEEFEMDKVLDIQDIFEDIKISDISSVEDDTSFKIDSEFRTLYINGGKKT